jgi:LuxR family transcriptional regulator, glucitol operon activator
MAYSATRLTCFALIAAIEDDMRAAIEANLSDRAIDDILPDDRVQRAQLRRSDDGHGAATAIPGLLPYLDFSDSYEALASNKGYLPEDLVASLKKLGPRLQRLIEIRNRVAHIRPMEIDDSAYLLDTADELAESQPSPAWATLSETIRRLQSDPSYVLGLTINLPADSYHGPQHNLPIPDFDETGFLGRKDQLRRIKKAIKGPYPVVSVLGDGGIGKTSLALKAAYELLDDSAVKFDAIVWVTAKATSLTTYEIKRINGAIESSLGLFAAAVAELGPSNIDNPVTEVLAYLENFRILLILDNLETVLDSRLRDFLLELPEGSKVVVTSRIGLGIENPVQLDELNLDDSVRLLRALARVRDVSQLTHLEQDIVEYLASKMSGHPAFIRWFVAGVQAGRRPEELLEDNGLLLDFCMSNVYEYLEDDARAVLRCMQALPGAKNQAELAFLNEFVATRIQSALLQLIRTNFVYMSSQASDQSVDTVYQLSEFGTQYLDKRHPVASDERHWLVDRQHELMGLGLELAAAYATPYSPETVNVRGPGDFHVARLLRDAIRQADSDPRAALLQCSEAQGLAPSYYETWRVEGFVRSAMGDHSAAMAAYERSLELAPENAVSYFHYGSYLLNDGGEPQRALELLQRAARMDPESSAIAGNIAWAHYCLGNMRDAADSCRHMLTLKDASAREKRTAVIIALQAASTGVRKAIDSSNYEYAAELLELSVEIAEASRVDLIAEEAVDRLIQLQGFATELGDTAEDYIAAKVKDYRVLLMERQRRASPDSIARRIGVLKTLKSDKGFGFVTSSGTDYFVHYRDLINRADWENLNEGLVCVFEAVAEDPPRHARATRLRVLPWAEI